MAGSILEWIKQLWLVLNSPDNDAIVVSLIILSVSLLFGYVVLWWNFHQRIKDKDREIEEIVEDRNYWERIGIKHAGLPKRRSTKTTQRKK